MNNNRYLSILVVTVISTLALAAAKPAFGEDIYNANGFENFMAGHPLVGQDGWVGVSVLSPEAAVVSTDQAFAGQKSVQLQAVKQAPVDFIDDVTHGYYDAIGSYRRPVNYNVAANGFPIVRIQAAVRIDGPLSPGNNFFSASVAARA